MSKNERARMKLIARLILLAVILGASPVFAGPAEMTVSAAISLKNVFEEIGRLYEARHEETRVVFNFGASGDLVRQIEGGAPVDIFASAAEKDLDEAAKKGFIIAGSRTDFASNDLVLIVPKASKAAIKDFEGLSQPAVKRIAVGDPGTVPAGRYAEEILRHYRLTAATKDKLIFAQNVRQALDYVARGEVDAGIVYKTDALLRSKEVKIEAVAPESSHTPAVIPIAVVKGTNSEAAAEAFISLVVSPEGKKILQKYGFKAAAP